MIHTQTHTHRHTWD